MRRLAYIIGALVLVLVLVFVLTSPDPSAPQFKKLRRPPTLPLSAEVSYLFSDPRPFANDKLWIHFAVDGANVAVLLYDLNHQQVLGRLANGWPTVIAADTRTVICAQTVIGLRERFKGLVGSIARRLLRKEAASPMDADPHSSAFRRYWLLDLERGTAIRIGESPAWSPASVVPSPDFQYAYGPLIRSGNDFDLCVLEIRSLSVEKMKNPPLPCGWWDNTRILCSTTNNDLALYDVVTKKTTELVSSWRIAEFLRENRVAAEFAPKVIVDRNGGRDEFYLTDTHERLMALRSFLISVERPDGHLRLVSYRFRFGSYGHFDPTRRYYVYSGHDGGQGSDAVFVRDMQSGLDRVLVASHRAGYKSLPRFYRDSVIYVRSNTLWRINLDGSSNLQLFPPPDAGSLIQDR
jgi:hypothetical protein